MIRLEQRLRTYAAGPNGRATIVAAIALASLLVSWAYAIGWYERLLLREERAEAVAATFLRGNTLSLAINRRLARLQGLYAFVQSESPSESFEARLSTFAREMFTDTQGIRYVAVAPGGIVRYVYPHSENEALVGYDMLGDRTGPVGADTQRAIESHRVVATGPVALPDGALALLARQPVYYGDTFWGLVSIALDVPVLLNDAGLTGDTGDLEFALRDSEQQLFFGRPEVLDARPVVVRVQLLEETWELAAAPVAGWGTGAGRSLLVFQAGGLIIAVLLTGLTYLSVNRQAQLGEAVLRRTREISRINEQLQDDITERRRAEAALAEREEQYRSIFESSSDGLCIFDLEGHLVDFNPAACRIHGYSPAEFGKLQPADLFHPGSMPLFHEFLGTVRGGRDFHGRAVHLRRDGTPFHVEVDGIGFMYRGQRHALAVTRDITEEVERYQLLEQRVQQRTHELATLLETSASIASTLELRPLLGLILEQLGKVVDCSAASIIILEENELREMAHRRMASGTELSLPHLGRGKIGQIWPATLSQEPLIEDDLLADSKLAQGIRRGLGLEADEELAATRAWMGIPFAIQAGARLTGWLFLYHRQPGAFTLHHAALVQTIANQAATAIENAHLFGQTRRLAALEERQRLARELHDSVSQVLYSIGLAGHTALALLERDPAHAAEPMDYVLSLADAGLAEMRALIFELRPDSLEKEGLVAALARQAAALRARHELEVQTELCEEPALSTPHKEALYRIAQEALNNVAKHAQARRVVIRLREAGAETVLEIQDDGIGFDPQRNYPGQIGLHSMRERAAELGGRLEIESAPGQGSLIRASFSSSMPPTQEPGAEAGTQ